MRNIDFVDGPNGVKIGDLHYGTVVTNVESNPNCVYMKVNKTKLGQGLHFEYPRKSSVLVNLKTGGLRAIPGDDYVIILDEQLTLQKADNPHSYTKGYAKEVYQGLQTSL